MVAQKMLMIMIQVLDQLTIPDFQFGPGYMKSNFLATAFCFNKKRILEQNFVTAIYLFCPNILWAFLKWQFFNLDKPEKLQVGKKWTARKLLSCTFIYLGGKTVYFGFEKLSNFFEMTVFIC